MPHLVCQIMSHPTSSMQLYIIMHLHILMQLYIIMQLHIIMQLYIITRQSFFFLIVHRVVLRYIEAKHIQRRRKQIFELPIGRDILRETRSACPIPNPVTRWLFQRKFPPFTILSGLHRCSLSSPLHLLDTRNQVPARLLYPALFAAIIIYLSKPFVPLSHRHPICPRICIPRGGPPTPFWDLP